MALAVVPIVVLTGVLLLVIWRANKHIAAAYSRGYRDGYDKARTVPIGRITGVSVDDGAIGVVMKFDDDVRVVP